MNNLTKSEMCKKSFFYNGCKSGYYFDLDYNTFEIENNNEIIFKCDKIDNNYYVSIISYSTIEILQMFINQIDNTYKIYISIEHIQKFMRIKKFISQYYNSSYIENEYLVVDKKLFINRADFMKIFNKKDYEIVLFNMDELFFNIDSLIFNGYKFKNNYNFDEIVKKLSKSFVYNTDIFYCNNTYKINIFEINKLEKTFLLTNRHICL
jgi:hypothetical protein